MEDAGVDAADPLRSLSPPRFGVALADSLAEGVLLLDDEARLWVEVADALAFELPPAFVLGDVDDDDDVL